MPQVRAARGPDGRRYRTEVAPLPEPAAVVFDLDGTLVDTVPARIDAWAAAFAERGIPAAREQLQPMIGMDGRRLAAEVASAAGIELGGADADDLDRRSGELFNQLNIDPLPLPGARELLARLDRLGITWAVATSSRPEQVARSIAALAVSGDARVVDGSHVENAKPAPDLLLYAARELATPTEATWYVGDSTWDMRAALAAGMPAIGVLAGAAVDGETLRAAGADAVVDTLDDLPVER